MGVRCLRSKQTIFSVQTAIKRNAFYFGCFSICFKKTNKNSFRFVSVIRTCTETIERNKPVSKQTKTNRNKSTPPLHLQVQRRLMDTSRYSTKSLVDKFIYRCSIFYCLIISNCKTNDTFFKKVFHC
jgi:hypothetical protein